MRLVHLDKIESRSWGQPTWKEKWEWIKGLFKK